MTTAGAGGTRRRRGAARSRDQFIAYAASQIRLADVLLADHRLPSWNGVCSCGRPSPCPHAETLRARRVHYRTWLELLDRTQPLPVVAPPTPPAAPARSHRSQRRLPRRLLTLLRQVLAR